MHSDWCFASNQNAPICPDHRGFYIPEVILHVHYKKRPLFSCGRTELRPSVARLELRQRVSRLWSYRTSSACLSVVVVQNFVRVSLGRGPERYQRVSLSWSSRTWIFISVSRSWSSRTLSATSSACLSVVVVQNLDLHQRVSVVVVQNVISNFISVSLCRGRPELGSSSACLGRGRPERYQQLHQRISLSWSSRTWIFISVSRSWSSRTLSATSSAYLSVVVVQNFHIDGHGT